jgi:hypothetical protein
VLCEFVDVMVEWFHDLVCWGGGSHAKTPSLKMYWNDGLFLPMRCSHFYVLKLLHSCISCEEELYSEEWLPPAC